MRKLRWGVIGAGGIARKRTIPGILLADNAQLTAIMDVNEEMVREIQGECGNPRAYVTAQELLADPEVEAVYIASPVFAHLEQVKAAAATGKHVLVEKPAGRTTAECEEMMDACERAGVKAGVGYMMRFHSYHQRIRQLIEEGVIGQVVSARAQQIFWYPDLPNCWRQEKAKSGGGALMDVGLHNIDLIEYLVGSRTRRVTGFTETRSFRYDVDDVSNLLIQLENGAVAYIDSAFNLRGTPGGNLLEIYGTRGTIIAHGTIGQVEEGKVASLVMDREGQRRQLHFDECFGNMYQKEIMAFSRAVLEKRSVPVPLEAGLWTQRVAEAAYEAQAQGRVVAVN